ncbi:MAG: hypothetical protein ABEK01_00175 [Candidatus Nanohaloarchaea archaeon]
MVAVMEGGEPPEKVGYSVRELDEKPVMDSFGTGTAVPNITDIRIFDVSATGRDRTGGDLLESGLNRTFTISQSSRERQYRFTFVIENDGSSVWDIDPGDELYHDGLNATWEVTAGWYNISGESYSGYSFTDRRLSWDTSGGFLDHKDGNDTMYASYVVNVTQNSSTLLDQHFLVNDTSQETGSQDFHELDITKYGFLNVTLDEPPGDTILSRYKHFSMNATVTCEMGLCGQVDLAVRYNESSTADTLIPENSGSPFHTVGPNRRSCSQDLGKGDSCYVNWTVNATGQLDSYHYLDSTGYSDLSSVEQNDSEDHQVRIKKPVLIDLTFDTVNFGVLDPGQENQPAKKNSRLAYNVTVRSSSITVDDLWIRGTDLRSRRLPDRYSIGIGNVSYSTSQNPSTEKPLSENYQHVASSISPGEEVETFYWIDVPLGIYSGGYRGKLYFKANSTR